MTLKNIQNDNRGLDIMDERAIKWAMSPTHELQVQKALNTWHYVRCANCGQWMSIMGAKFNERYAPIHNTCGGSKNG